jgi:hypothetical protein
MHSWVDEQLQGKADDADDCGSKADLGGRETKASGDCTMSG